MKMPKEYVLVLIVGLFLLAYLLEAVVDPLAIPLATPYEFLRADYITKVPFTTALIIVRSLAIFITPLWLLSFIDRAWQFKAIALLVIGVLLQLYAVQSVASTSVSVNVLFDTTHNISTHVRRSGIIPFNSNTISLTSSGYTATAVRTTDSIVT